MKKAKEIGKKGELLAEKYLKRRFWRIVSNNYNANGGEIDIIGYRFGVLAFFEVKARSNDKYGSPASAVNNEKLRRIELAANHFLKTYCPNNSLPRYGFNGQRKYKHIMKKRIDVIEVYLSENNRINHIKDFYDGELK